MHPDQLKNGGNTGPIKDGTSEGGLGASPSVRDYDSAPAVWEKSKQWMRDKYKGVLEDREKFKKQHLATQNMSILTTVNDNAQVQDGDKKLSETMYTGG